MLENLQKDDQIAGEQDRLGGGMPEAGLYDTAIEMAYFDKSKGGATALKLTLVSADGVTIRQDIWLTSGTAKGCKNYYLDRSGNKQYLPGFIVGDSLCELTLGKGIAAVTPEEREVKVYDFDAKAEIPQKKQVITELLGKRVACGIIIEKVNKNVKNAAGDYVPSAETRDQIVIDKFFEAGTLLTTVEKKAGLSAGEFAPKWVEKNRGTVRDRTVAADPSLGNSVTPGAPAAGQTTAPLFS